MDATIGSLLGITVPNAHFDLVMWVLLLALLSGMAVAVIVQSKRRLGWWKHGLAMTVVAWAYLLGVAITIDAPVWVLALSLPLVCIPVFLHAAAAAKLDARV